MGLGNERDMGTKQLGMGTVKIYTENHVVANDSCSNGEQRASLTLNRPGGGGGIRPQAGSSLCCAETVSSRKPKLCDFYYILIGLNSEYKPVP